MTNAELLRTLSGCRFHRQYLQQQGRAVSRPAESGSQTGPVLGPSQSGAKARASPGRQRAIPSRQQIDEVFWNSCRMMAGGVAASLLLFVVPFWLVYPPYGRACLLSLPPMLLCATSWTVAARWAWDRDIRVLMAVTLGAMPLRLLFLLSWAWLVLTIPGIAKAAFVAGMMWHWAVFSAAEFVMMVRLSRGREAAELSRTAQSSNTAAEQAKDEDDEVRIAAPAPAGRIRLRRYRDGDSELAGAATRPTKETAEVLR